MGAVARVLLISCSQRKTAAGTDQALPAFDLYDGGAYRILKKLQREGNYPADLAVWILSARYGLITAETLVSTYEQRMSKERAAELRIHTCQRLHTMLTGLAQPVDMCVSMGADYKGALPSMADLGRHQQVAFLTVTSGGIGTQLGQLRSWVTSRPL